MQIASAAAVLLLIFALFLMFYRPDYAARWKEWRLSMKPANPINIQRLKKLPGGMVKQLALILLSL